MIETNSLLTPRGAPATVVSRGGTSDLSLAGSMFQLWGRIDDEYDLASLRVDGPFVDVGAHIGLVTLAVLLDNPSATAICLEPVPDNLDLLAQNMDANDVAARVQALQGAIGPGREVAISYGLPEGDPLHGERYIGGLQVARPMNTESVTVPAFTLAKLVKRAGGRIDALKIDCEGCEWQALAEPAVKDVRVIFGEWHGHPLGATVDGIATLRTMIGKTHTVEAIRETGGIGTFRAVRK